MFYCLLAFCSLVLLGCSKKANENKSLSEVKAEAEKMSVKQLQSMAMKYKVEITRYKYEIDKYVALLKYDDERVENAEIWNAKINELRPHFSALKERFEVYYEKLKEKGGDLSGLEIRAR